MDKLQSKKRHYNCFPLLPKPPNKSFANTSCYVASGAHKEKERPTSVTILYIKSTYLKYSLYGSCYSRVSGLYRYLHTYTCPHANRKVNNGVP